LINNREVPYEPRLATPIGGELLTQAPSARAEARAFWEGVGPANFGGPYLRHKLPTSSEEIQDPHDFVLEIWACSGLAATIAALGWLTSGLGVIARGEPEVAEEAGDRPDEPAAGRWIVAGSAAGWVLVAVLGRLDPFKGDLLMRWIVLGAAWGIGLATIHPLWNRRAIPASLFGAALIAICVNLLAAGGISVPAVALGVWIPLALGLTLRETNASGRVREVPGIGLGVLAAIVWAAIVGTFHGSVTPHWRSEAAIARGDAYAGAPLPAYEKARAEYLDACTLDRFASAPWLSLATLEFRYWTSPEGGQKSGHWRNIFQTLDKAVQPPLRNPDALPVRRFQATMARQVLQRLPGAIPMEILFLREQIARAARNQARLYPTSAEIRAQLAFASAELGMYVDAISEAKIALELDGITPHADKKLSPAVRVQLQGAIANWTEAASAAAAIRKPKE
jgi:hypothetical protein